MDVSVIIVSWNAREYLLKCLDSLANPAGYTQEILVVDNASTDGSCEAVERQFPEVQLIRNAENVGFARGNNIAIRKAKGRYLALINSDVVVLDDCLPRLLQFMEENPRAGLVGPRILNPDRTLQARCRHFPTVWNNLCQIVGLSRLFPKCPFVSESFMRYWAHDDIRKVDVITGCFWFARREAVDAVGLLDEGFFFYGEDVDWCKRFHDAGWDVVFYPHAEAIHFGGASSRNAPVRFYLELQKADLRYWRKHHGRLGRCGCWLLILLRHLVRVPYDAVTYLLCASRRAQASYKLQRAVACLRWLLSGGLRADGGQRQ